MCDPKWIDEWGRIRAVSGLQGKARGEITVSRLERGPTVTIGGALGATLARICANAGATEGGILILEGDPDALLRAVNTDFARDYEQQAQREIEEFRGEAKD